MTVTKRDRVYRSDVDESTVSFLLSRAIGVTRSCEDVLPEVEARFQRASTSGFVMSRTCKRFSEVGHLAGRRRQNADRADGKRSRVEVELVPEIA